MLLINMKVYFYLRSVPPFKRKARKPPWKSPFERSSQTHLDTLLFFP